MGKRGMGEAWRRNNQEIRRLIASEEDFVAKGGRLVGDYVDGLLPTFEGLKDEDAERYLQDAPLIRYAVWSYGWPIHWVTDEGDGYTITHPPSKTTAGHRNLCPGYKQTREAK